ncbi:MAG TPA: protease inhibitor I42 family protein [Acidimicrobiia bacterium]
MSKRSVLIVGLVLVALVAAGALAATAMSSDEPSEPQAFTAADRGRSIELGVGESFSIVLDGNPTTGYGWQVDGIDESVLSTTDPEYRSDSNLIGSGGQYTFTFTGVAAGQTQVRLVYLRPWEQAEPLETFVLTVTVH